MKRIPICAAVLLGLLSALAPVFAEDLEEEVVPGLECNYTGTWSMKGAKGQFSWHGFWFAGDGGWILRANGKDSTGISHLRAGCGAGECNFSQAFVSGKYKGQTFNYLSKYKGELPENGPQTLAFSGTWGKGESYTNGGSWKATPKCTQKANIGDLPKVLGWPVWD
ncbi:MAG: hypothetical protein ACAI44_39685 [Candidatus Sericytochromatia bacterium]